MMCWLGFHAWRRIEAFIGRGLLYCVRCGRVSADD